MEVKSKKKKVEHLYSGKTDTLSANCIEEKKIRRSAMPPMTTEEFRNKMELFRTNMGAEGEEFPDFATVLEDLDRKEMEERIERERQLQLQRQEEEELQRQREEEQKTPEEIDLTLVNGQAPREAARVTAMRIVNNPLFKKRAAKITSWNKGGFSILAASIDQLQRSVYNGKLTEKELITNLLAIIRNCNSYYEDHKTRRRSIFGAMRKSRVKDLSDAMSAIVRDTAIMSPELSTYLCERMAMDRHPGDVDTILGRERMTKFIQEKMIADFKAYAQQKDDPAVLEAYKENVVKHMNHENFILSYIGQRISGNDADGAIVDRQTAPLYELHSEGTRQGTKVVLSKNAADQRGYKRLLKPVHYNYLGKPDAYEDKQNKTENDTIIEHLTLVKKNARDAYHKDDTNVEHRKYVLERHVKDILSFPISTRMLSPKHIMENPEQAINISALTQDYILSITKTNRDLYLQLSETVKRQVTARLDLLLNYSTFVQYYLQFMSCNFSASDVSTKVSSMQVPKQFQALESIMDKLSQGANIQFEQSNDERFVDKLEGGDGIKDLGVFTYNYNNVTAMYYASFYKSFQSLAPLIDESVDVHTPIIMYLPKGIHTDSARKQELFYRQTHTKQRMVKGYPDGCEQDVPGVYAYYLDATKQRRMAMLRAEERTGITFDGETSIKLLEHSGLFQEVIYAGNGEPLDAENLKRRTRADEYLVRLYFYEKAKANPRFGFSTGDVEKFPFLKNYKTAGDFVHEVEHDEEHLQSLYELLMAANVQFNGFSWKKWSDPTDEMDWVDRFNEYAGILDGILRDPTYLALGFDEEKEAALESMKLQVETIKTELDREVEKVCGMRADANGMYEYSPEKIDEHAVTESKRSPLYFLRGNNLL